MRVLHLPWDVGGNGIGLAKGERKVGLHSDVLIVEQGRFKYPADRILFPEPLPASLAGRIRKAWGLLKCFLEVRNAYDVFHFNFGSSLLDFRGFGLDLMDLPLYPSSAKIVVTYNGCDARQKYPTMARTSLAACHESECYGGQCNSGKLDRQRAQRIEKFKQYADGMLAVNPDLLYFLPEGTGFLPYTIASWDDLKDEGPVGQGQKLRIAHAPSNRVCKGSGFILTALARLQAAYPDRVEVLLIEDLTNTEALAMLAKADLLIDQVLVGWYGGVAVEAMKMGKPVMVFLREEDMKFVSPAIRAQIREAFLNTTPDQLFPSLCTLVENPNLLVASSQAARAYVNDVHDPVRVGAFTKSFYEAL